MEGFYQIARQRVDTDSTASKKKKLAESASTEVKMRFFFSDSWSTAVL